MHRYLFLDIDGVLNSERTVAAYGKLTHCGRVKHDMLAGKPLAPMWDDISVKLIQAAQAEIGFSIVISSSWRMFFSVSDFHTIFDLYGWDTRGIIVGKTGESPGSRGVQIKEWLTTHGKFPYSYCILDDDSDMLPEQSPFFVQTSFKNGITMDNFHKLYEVLGAKYSELGVLDLR